jgi:hypothetical protein
MRPYCMLWSQSVPAQQPPAQQATLQEEDQQGLQGLDDDMLQDEQGLGPEQGGASGLPPDENPQPQETNEIVTEALTRYLREHCSNHQPFPAMMDWPAQCGSLRDNSTPNLQAMAFPTLFPYGRRDVTRPSRNTPVTLTEANRHLLTYAVWDPTREVFIYPFGEHARWVHWAREATVDGSERRLPEQDSRRCEPYSDESLQKEAMSSEHC